MKNSIIAMALKTCNNTYEKVIIADVNLKELIKATNFSEEECKELILVCKKIENQIGVSFLGVEFDTDLFLKIINKLNEDKKINKKFKKEDLEILGYKKQGEFYFKKPNLAENKKIKSLSTKNKEIDFELLGAYFLLECAYYQEEGNEKEKMFDEKQIKILLKGDSNNPFLPTSLKYWVKLTTEMTYMGLEEK
jgi:hypothetical protein